MDNNFILEWFNFADIDLALAIHALSMHPQPLEAICYHCQQAVEKYLKGYIVYNGINEPPKIHNLDVLCKICEDYDERFIETRKICTILNRYGVQPRYPHEMEITEPEVIKALDYAKQMQNFEPLIEARKKLESIL